MSLACGPFGISFLAGRGGSVVVPGAFPRAAGGGGGGGHHGSGAILGLGGGGATLVGARFGVTIFGVGTMYLWGGGHGQYLPLWVAAGRKAGIIPPVLGGRSGSGGLAEPLAASGSGDLGGTAVFATTASDTSALLGATALFGTTSCGTSASPSAAGPGISASANSAGVGLAGKDGKGSVFSGELPSRLLLLDRVKMDLYLSFGSRPYLSQIFL